jgi:hypothetical protein
MESRGSNLTSSRICHTSVSLSVCQLKAPRFVVVLDRADRTALVISSAGPATNTKAVKVRIFMRCSIGCMVKDLQSGHHSSRGEEFYWWLGLLVAGVTGGLGY